MDEVARIRREIDRVDQETISLLKTRYELAGMLGRIKRIQGLPIRDQQRERAILLRSQQIAEVNGLPTESIRQIFLETFAMALSAQSPSNDRHVLQGYEVLIAGGTGGMGKLFACILAKHGASVKIFGRSRVRTRRVARDIGVLPGSYSDAGEVSIVVVSLPMEVTPRVALRLGSMMSPEGLLADLSSVKTGIADVISRGTKLFEYVSIHPLFGPDIAHIGGQQIAAIPYRAGSLWKKLLMVFKQDGAEVIVTTAREHDAMMAKIQALHHFALISLGITLGGDVGEFSTRSLRSTQSQIQRLTNNWETVLGIQKLNPFAARERDRFHKIVSEIKNMGPRDTAESHKLLARYVQNWSRKQ
jgi:chorismate mutase/prephenate dehydrogenase